MASKFPRVLSSVLLIVAAALVAFPLTQYFFPRVQTLSATVGDAQIQIGTDRIAADSEGCLMAEWSIEGVEAVYVHTLLQAPQPTVGESQQRLCTDRDMYWVWTVSLLDGSTERYRLPVIVSTARIWGLYALLSVGLLAGAALLWVPLPKWNVHIQVPSRWQTLAAVLGLGAIVLALYIPARFIVYGGDYEPHVYYTRDIANGAPISSPHFTYQLAILALAPFFSGDDRYFSAGFAVHLIFELLTVWVLFFFLRQALMRGEQPPNVLLVSGFTLALMLAAPISIVGLPAYTLYNGYIPSSNVFHNPTYVMMRPMSLALWWLILRIFRREYTHGWAVGLLAAALTALSLITKPNAVIVMVPIVGLAVLYSAVRLREWRWLPVLAIILPSIPILLVQFGVFFTNNDAEMYTEPSSVIFAPLAAMLTREPSVLLLALKFWLSVVFPLVLVVRYAPQMRHSLPMSLSWGMFAIGVGYAYLLAESGKINHGNFIWCAQIALDVLFISSAVWLFNAKPAREHPLLWTLFALHIVSGGVWHMVNVASGYGFFWW